jgi:Tfp pilus tip-associated adhesin PilY1
MWRLTTHGDPDISMWGVAGAPTTLLSAFGCVADVCNNLVGPIGAAPNVTIDDGHNYWVIFSSGRLITGADTATVDPQYAFGVKDCVLSSPCAETPERPDLYDVSNIAVCTSCSPTANVSINGGTDYTIGLNQGVGNLVDTINRKDGWVLAFPYQGERALNMPVVVGGTVFFTTFTPAASLCDFGGEGRLYSLYYATGSAYTNAGLGTRTDLNGRQVGLTSISLGDGMSSQVAVHIEANGDGTHGETGSGVGCSSQVSVDTQTSTGAIVKACVKPALAPWSRLIAWRDL